MQHQRVRSKDRVSGRKRHVRAANGACDFVLTASRSDRHLVVPVVVDEPGQVRLGRLELPARILERVQCGDIATRRLRIVAGATNVKRRRLKTGRL